MIRHISAAALLALLSSTALAADLPKSVSSINPDSSVEDIQKALTAAGFTQLSNVTKSGNVIRAKGVYAGEQVEFVVGAGTGRVYDQSHPTALKLTPTTSDDEIKNELVKHGYSNITEVERRGNFIVVTGQKAGQPVEVIVDATSGRVSDDLASNIDYIHTRNEMSESYVTQELQRLGYTGVTDVKRIGDVYRAKATKGGKALDVRVNGRTGAVTSRG